MRDMLELEAMAPAHHPSDELLVAYAAGSLPEAPSLVVATHLALCPTCRAEVRRLEAVGGSLLEEMPPATIGDDVLAGLLAQLDGLPNAHAPHPAAAPVRRPKGGAPQLPEPLRGYLGCDLDGVRWSKVMRGVDETAPISTAGGKAKLLRIAGGTGMPKHTHGGSELTLVLAGAFADESGRYGRGDFSGTDGTVDHRPLAEAGQDCICLTVTDAPLKLTGRFTRLLNPFIRF